MASGFCETKKRIVSSTANRDFGKGNSRPGMNASRTDESPVLRRVVEESSTACPGSLARWCHRSRRMSENRRHQCPSTDTHPPQSSRLAILLYETTNPRVFSSMRTRPWACRACEERAPHPTSLRSIFPNRTEPRRHLARNPVVDVPARERLANGVTTPGHLRLNERSGRSSGG